MSERSYEEEIEEAHERRVARLRSATGWLSLVDKVFLGEGLTKLHLPDGTFTGDIFVTGKRVELDGRHLKSDAEGRADAVNINGFVIEVMERGDTLALRIRDNRELPRPFAGISRFAVDPAWRKVARFSPYPEPKEVFLDFEGATAGGGVTDRFLAPGFVTFEHDGAKHHLEAVWLGADRKGLVVMFRDATSGKDSYPLGRLVNTDAPDATGSVIVDFNRAIIPGCAFSIYATCPIPPRENHLAIEIRAGERFYQGKAIGEP